MARGRHGTLGQVPFRPAWCTAARSPLAACTLATRCCTPNRVGVTARGDACCTFNRGLCPGALHSRTLWNKRPTSGSGQLVDACAMCTMCGLPPCPPPPPYLITPSWLMWDLYDTSLFFCQPPLRSQNATHVFFGMREMSLSIGQARHNVGELNLGRYMGRECACEGERKGGEPRTLKPSTIVPTTTSAAPTPS